MKLFFGIILLTIGVLLVFGLIDASLFSNAFENLFYLWPFILIMIGLSILSNVKGLRWLRVINSILIIGFAFALFFFPADFLSDGVYKEIPFQIALDGDSEKNIIELEIGTVYLEVVSDRQLSDMITGTYVSREDDMKIYMSGNRLKISRKDDYKFYLFKKPRNELHLKVPEDGNLELLIDSAVLKSDLILKKNPFEIIDINTAILNMNMEVEEFTVPMKLICESAINDLKIKTSGDLNYSRTMESAINNISISDVFKEVDYNPDLDVQVRSAINTFSLKSKDDE